MRCDRCGNPVNATPLTPPGGFAPMSDTSGDAAPLCLICLTDDDLDDTEPRQPMTTVTGAPSSAAATALTDKEHSSWESEKWPALRAISSTASRRSNDPSATSRPHDGVDHLRLGPLETGGFGLEGRIGDVMVPYDHLAGGTAAATATNEVTYDADTGGWQPITGGPTLGNVQVYTGRMLVMMTAHVVVQDIASLYFGHELAGPTPVEPTETRSAFLRGRIETSTVANIMFAVMHAGLTPGTYTVEARALAVDVQEIPSIPDILLGTRTLIAIPY